MRIACLGGAGLDTKARLAAPARPGTSNPARLTRTPGGVACNVARSLARLGVPVMLCSIVGDDEQARALRADLIAAGVDTSGMSTDRGHRTAGYLAVLDPDGSLVLGVADMEIYDQIGEAWIDETAAAAADCDTWVVDANLPAVTLEGLLARAPGRVLADPVSIAKADRLVPSLGLIDVVFPDRGEAAVLAGRDPSAVGEPADDARAIRERGAGSVVITLGPDGIYLDGGSETAYRKALMPASLVDVTGAGDALLAGYVYGSLVGGEQPPEAWGLAAASLAVETDASVPAHLDPETLRNRLAPR